ncbi:hypothetical protein [Spirosoma gilvum]
MIDFNITKQNLLTHLKETQEQIQNAVMPSQIESKYVTTSQIKNEEYIRQFAKKLPTSEHHIYWFEVDNSELLISQFGNKGEKVDYKCPRDNKGTDSKYVYVGSCTKTKLSSRFLQHCGWGNDQTYSLQLKKWLDENELTFTFSYVQIKNQLIIQYFEDQLHKDLNPLFGKSGGNNKTATKK